ncbi:MAG: hypothetical protein AAB036_07980 [Elusimicrobiota bacterium]
MMKSFGVAVLAGLLTVSAAIAAEHKHEQSKAAAKTASFSGELVDMACFMKHDGRGAKHASCAQMCVKGGAPLGVHTKEGQVYLLINDHGNEKPFAQAKLLAGGNAIVTGEVVSRGGVQAIIVSKVEKL